MEYQSPNIETRQALDDLQRYLSDRVAPLMVSDSIALLMERPADLVATQIHAWTSGQYRGVGANSGISPASYFFHALKKLHLVGEFKLVPHDHLQKFIADVARILVNQHCPADERQLLADNIAMLGHAEIVDSSSVEILHRPSGATPVGSMGSGGPGGGGSGGGGGGGLSSEEARGLRRFSLLLDRLIEVPQVPLATGVSIPESQADLLSQIMTTAVVGSHTQSELDHYFARLRETGMEPRTDQVFRVLARGLPGFGIVVPSGTVAVAGGAPPPGTVTPGGIPIDGPIEAMHRLITLPEDPEEGAKRFSEMVQAAIEQFNEGALAPAVAMFDLADRIMTEKKIQEGVARSILHRAHEGLDPVRLGKLAEKPEKHALLRRVLSFFPDTTPRGLLDDLEKEPKRDRRKLLLALLEAHGLPARTAAYEDLKASVEGKRLDIDSFHQRNLVFLLRRIPRGPEESVDEEINLLLRVSGSKTPPIVRKETIAALGQIKHDRTEHALIGLMHEFEERAINPATSALDRQEYVLLLDRAVYALSRLGTQPAWRAVIDHCLRGSLSDSMSRLANLAGIDLSADKESVARLTKALHDQLPVKVLGFVVSKRDDRVSHLIKALSTTPAAPVRHALEDIIKRYPDHDFAALAEKTVQGFGAILRPHEAMPVTTLSGDLELFGLPNLLQTLAESHVTGALSLMDSEGESIGVLHFENGMFRNCQVGALRGDEAVYQLFEKPVPGTFALRSRRDGSHESEQTEEAREVLPVVLEACRRYDEFRKARALVPDEAALKPTGSKPTRTVEESDIGFLRALWSRISSGATPEDCERALATDSYRIRCLLAHWLETGALAFQHR